MLVGIDLGTTHSLIGRFGEGGAELAPNALGERLTPSVVSLDDEDRIIIGQAARDRLITHADRSVATFKRWMGSDRVTTLGRHRFRPEELSALVLRQLLADAKAHFGQAPSEAVISVPAYFSDAQRKATRTAGELAGVKVELLINEPTAAALAYGLQKQDHEGRFLVFDLGGGTLDVSILEMFDGVVEVHASAGDNLLGGEDFLDALVTGLRRDLGLEKQALPAEVLAQLRRKLEQMKRELTQHDEVQIELPAGLGATPWRMNQARFASLCEPLVQRMRAPLERAMRDARLQPSQLDEIVLVGGASRMPMAVQLVSKMFGRLPLRHVNPDEAIALGACVAAGLKGRDERLEEVVLTDVCPYTLGTQVSRTDSKGKVDTGYFHPIIQRNCTVPVSREDTFYPASAGQKALVIDVYQGESPWVKNNIELGAIRVALNPKLSVDDNGVKVRFTYDVNGLLQVEVTELATGQRHELIVQQGQQQMTDAEIRQRIQVLAALKVHPREQQENVAVLARAERAYTEFLHDREDIQHWIVIFRQALETQDRPLVEKHRTWMNERLDGLEGLR